MTANYAIYKYDKQSRQYVLEGQCADLQKYLEAAPGGKYLAHDYNTGKSLEYKVKD